MIQSHLLVCVIMICIAEPHSLYEFQTCPGPFHNCFSPSRELAMSSQLLSFFLQGVQSKLLVSGGSYLFWSMHLEPQIHRQLSMNSHIFLSRDMTTCLEEEPPCTQRAAKTFEAKGGKYSFPVMPTCSRYILQTANRWALKHSSYVCTECESQATNSAITDM